MKCEKIPNVLIDYVYDQLTPSQKADYEKHLEHCRECQHELAELRQTRTALNTLSDPEPLEKIMLAPDRGTGMERWLQDFRKVIPHSAWGRIVTGGIAALLALMVFSSLLHLQVQYSEGHFAMSFGVATPQKTSVVTLSEAQKDTLAAQIQQKNLEVIQALLQKNQQAQMNQLKEIMSDYAYAIQQKQDQNLQKINMELNSFYRHASMRFQQTDQALSDIIQTVQYNH